MAAGLFMLPAWAARPSRATADDYLTRAREYAAEYRPEEAREQYDAYEKAMRRARKEIPAQVEAERSALVMMENMLERVEQIEVFDSLTVDSADFFRYYRLSPEAGKILPGSAARIPGAPMAYLPQSNTEILYALPDSVGDYQLTGADILDDGTIDSPRPLGVDSGGGSSRFPFLMSDGVTLYYAHDGEGSLGGYDIFLTRRSDDSFLQPQNVGMPYNSPFNDYLLAIDETTGAGWWATDRNHIEGKVTVYVFKPSATRVNVDPGNPDHLLLARMADISLTQPQGADYTDIRRRIENISNATAAGQGAESATFELQVGNRIYHHLSDFSDTDARRAMGRAINARAAIASLTGRLAAMREEYRRGNRTREADILNMEQQLDEERNAYREAVNDAIAAETGQL